MTNKKIIVTGASGLLGREVFDLLKSIPNCTVEGWSLSRAEKLGHRRVDMTNAEELEQNLKDSQVSVKVSISSPLKNIKA